jgi:hypothetical protein
MTMAHWILKIIGLLFMAVPLSLLLTLLATPLWSWLERAHGLEAIGHSGPAEWCFFAVFAVISVLLLAGFARR